MDFNVAFGLVKSECESATEHNKPFNSPEEGLAVIMEEFEELKAEVFTKPEARTMVKLRSEATQLAAMAIRFMVDLT